MDKMFEQWVQAQENREGHRFSVWHKKWLREAFEEGFAHGRKATEKNRKNETDGD